MSPPLWREIQKKNFTNLSKLAEYLQVAPSLFGFASRFPLNLPLRLAEKIAKGTLDDPILKQFIPLKEENLSTSGYVKDPVEDATFCKSPKLLQKYSGRALLLSTSACAMHCRYCFRQNFSYEKESGFEEELELIKNDPSLHEVILSGGDPLSQSDRALEELLEKLDEIEHIHLIRFHTRFPIGIPERITPSFLTLLQKCRKQIVFVIHANHPKELDDDVLFALKQIQQLGIPTLQQAVLLKGVNDDLDTLMQLCKVCGFHGVIPYYLHQLDQVEGAAHFFVTKERGMQLIEDLRKSVPGYCVPKFVQEIPNRLSKTPLHLI